MQQLLIRIYSACTRIPLLRRFLRSAFVQQCCQRVCDSLRMTVQTRPGFRMSVDILNIRTAAEIRETGFYEPSCSQVLLKELRPGMNVIDAGANIGYYSVLFSQAVGETGTVFAFEPDIRCMSLLRHNIAQNHCRNIQVIERCLSDRDGSVSFYISGHTAMSSLTQENVLAARQVTSASTTIDTIMKEKGNPHIDLIKMDIQGAELRCLQGAADTLQRNPDIRLLIEFWPEGLKRAGTNPVDLLRFLTDRGFSIRCIQHEDYADPAVSPEAFTEKVSKQAKDVYDCYVDVWAWRTNA